MKRIILSILFFVSLGAHAQPRILFWATNKWTPASHPNKLFWVKPDVGITTGTNGASQTVVTQWNDQSGNARNLTTTSVETAPIWTASDINGYGSLKGDAVDNFLRTSSNFPSFTNITIYMICTYNSADAEYSRLLDCNYSSGFWLGKISGYRGAADAGNAPYGASQSASNNTFYTVRIRSDNTTSYLSVNNNTETSYTESGNTNAPDKLALFASPSLASVEFSSVKIVEIFISGNNDDATTRGKVETYLKSRFNHY